MSGKNLIICDSSFSYATFLMENIMEKEELFVDVQACTSWECAKELLEEKPADIVLVDEKWETDAKGQVGIGQVVCLVEDRESEEEHKKIYRYQSADAIIEKLFVGEQVFRMVQGQKQHLIAVYSPVHRVGKTRLSVALGKALGRKTKTLYLNLEDYPGSLFEYADSSKGNLGDLIYYMKQDSPDIGLRLDSMIQSEGKLFYVLPIPLCSDLKEVTALEWQQLLDMLCKTSYETIIIDPGESVQGLYEILKLCDRICMPVLGDEISVEKVSCYEENLKKQGLESLIHKTKKIMVEGETADETVRRIAREDFGEVGFVERD